MIRNRRGKFSRLNDALAGEEQLAIRKEMHRGVGLEGVAFLHLAAARWDVNLSFADFHIEKLGGGLFQDRIVSL